MKVSFPCMSIPGCTDLHAFVDGVLEGSGPSVSPLSCHVFDFEPIRARPSAQVSTKILESIVGLTVAKISFDRVQGFRTCSNAISQWN